MSRDELFDLSQRSALRDTEPLVLVFRDCHSRKLARRRPVDGAVSEGLCELRQMLEGFGDAQTLGSPPRRIAKETLDILGERREPERQMSPRSKRDDQPATLLPIEMRPCLCQTRKLFMRST